MVSSSLVVLVPPSPTLGSRTQMWSQSVFLEVTRALMPYSKPLELSPFFRISSFLHSVFPAFFNLSYFKRQIYHHHRALFFYYPFRYFINLFYSCHCLSFPFLGGCRLEKGHVARRSLLGSPEKALGTSVLVDKSFFLLISFCFSGVMCEFKSFVFLTLILFYFSIISLNLFFI